MSHFESADGGGRGEWEHDSDDKSMANSAVESDLPDLDIFSSSQTFILDRHQQQIIQVVEGAGAVDCRRRAAAACARKDEHRLREKVKKSLPPPPPTTKN